MKRCFERILLKKKGNKKRVLTKRPQYGNILTISAKLYATTLSIKSITQCSENINRFLSIF